MELEIAWMCGDHHLPDSGGILDQDGFLMRKITACRNVYGTLYRMKHLKGADIHKMTDNERKIVRSLMEGGYRLG
jgi:hypothetical protein